MKLMKIFFVLLVGILAGGFVWLAVTDIPVQQHTVTKTIPNDQFIQ